MSLNESDGMDATSLKYEKIIDGMKMPGVVCSLMGRIYRSPKLPNKIPLKKDAKNAVNAAANPASFETRTQIPPEAGYDFSDPNPVCPLASFARKYDYEECRSYLRNPDQMNFGLPSAPLYREHTGFEDGDYCDCKLKPDARVSPCRPSVFS